MLKIIRDDKNLDNKFANLFVKAIIRQCKKENINYDIVIIDKDYPVIPTIDVNPSIIIEPYSYVKPKLYDNIDTNTTAEVIKDICIIHEFSKNVLIINRSDLIGRPLANMLLDNDKTVTIAHSKTIDIQRQIDLHDIIVVATGNKMDYKFRNKIVIDISNDVSLANVYNSIVYNMKYVGDRTVEKIVEKARN